MAKENNHHFQVNLDGLNLSEAQLQRINLAIQKTVMTELASIDLKITKGGLISSLRPPIWGIIYRPDLGIEFKI